MALASTLNTCSFDLRKKKKRYVLDEPVIVGAGPSGLATAACLREKGVSCVILEREDCIASLWQQRTYDRLKLHLPKQFCQLPFMPYPEDFPVYPDKYQVIEYLVRYADRFDLRPEFHESVKSATYDETATYVGISGWWKVVTENRRSGEETEYCCRWLIVATGENAEAVVLEFSGRESFRGNIIHASEYKTGLDFEGRKVLVVGFGQSGMEISLDLCNYNAHPSIVVRSPVHVLPRDILGISTFVLEMWLLKWLPLRGADFVLLLLAWMMLGDTSRYGLRRPAMGPLEFKNSCGKSPVLGVGTLAKIKEGQIKVVPAIECFKSRGVKFVDGQQEEFDTVILATGYRSNVPSWLQGCDFFSANGLPVTPFPDGWKGQSGLYAVGFTKLGLLGASMDATRIAEDIANQCRPPNDM